MHARVTANLIQLQPANSPRRTATGGNAPGDSDFSGRPSRNFPAIDSLSPVSHAWDDVTRQLASANVS